LAEPQPPRVFMQQNLTSCQPLPLLLERQILVKKCKDLAGKRLKTRLQAQAFYTRIL